MRYRTLTAVLLLCPVCALAQLCTRDDSITSCQQKVADSYAATSGPEANVEESAKAAVAAANTGAVEQPAQPTTAVTDFNSLVQMAADSGGIGNDDQAITINFNNFIDVPLPDYQAKVVLRHAALNDAIAKQLRAAGAEARVSELEGSLNDFDNPTLSFSYSPAKRGRNPGHYQMLLLELFNEPRDEILRTATRDTVHARGALVKAQNDAIPLLPPADADTLETLSFSTIEQHLEPQLKQKLQQQLKDQLKPQVQGANKDAVADSLADTLTDNPARSDAWARADALREAAERAQRVASDRELKLHTLLNDERFFNLVDLIDNQPQLFVSVEANSPDQLVGPRTTSAKVTWEKGFVNIDGFQAECGTNLTLTCLGTYLNKDNRLETLARGDRIALSIEYKNIGDYNVTLPEDGVTVTAPHDKSIVGSFTYGRYLRTKKTTQGKPRIDIAMQYENVDNETLRQDRFVTTATFSQRLSDASILSFGVVYANKPEFRGDVDKEISARLGINYRLGNNK
jgi:hypothetical protein